MQFYSERGEDRAISYLYEGVLVQAPFFVDVGAFDGIQDSNTYFFESCLKWVGICVEPHPNYFPICVKNRPLSVCLNVAAWHEDGESSEFYATMPGGASRIGRFEDLKKTLEMYPIIEVAEPVHVITRTLDTIFKIRRVPPRFEILSVDVEGTELEVFRGFTLDDYFPRIVIVEYTHIEGERSRRPHHSPPDSLYGYFSKCGYVPVNNKKSHNAIFCRDREDAEKIARSWMWEGSRGFVG